MTDDKNIRSHTPLNSLLLLQWAVQESLDLLANCQCGMPEVGMGVTYLLACHDLLDL